MAVLTLIVSVLVFVSFIIGVAGMLRGRGAQRKVGNGRGMTFNQIVKKMGKPQAHSLNADGDSVYQWQFNGSSGGYHYVYVFRNGICLGLVHSSVS
jgi:hypothetical protein